MALEGLENGNGHDVARFPRVGGIQDFRVRPHEPKRLRRAGSPNWYFGPNQYTDWAFGGNASASTPKWYWGGTSFKFNLDTYGLWLVEPLGATQPGSPYAAFDSTTWAHQYLIGSVRPNLKVGFGGDFYIGGDMEYAWSQYTDDETIARGSSSISPFWAGLIPAMGRFQIDLQLPERGPLFLLADGADPPNDISNPSNPGPYVYSGDLFFPVPRSQYFLSNITRPGGIYSFYDRTQDNTFPYGFGNPQPPRGRVELDVKTLKDKALKIKGSAYFVQEISGNLVVNGNG